MVNDWESCCQKIHNVLLYGAHRELQYHTFCCKFLFFSNVLVCVADEPNSGIVRLQCGLPMYMYLPKKEECKDDS